VQESQLDEVSCWIVKPTSLGTLRDRFRRSLAKDVQMSTHCLLREVLIFLADIVGRSQQGVGRQPTNTTTTVNSELNTIPQSIADDYRAPSALIGPMFGSC
jgi:hypothetical protein